MDFLLLGPLAVTDGAQDLTPTAPKHRALLAALALEAGRAASVDRLIQVVWDGRPPARAPAVLRVYAHDLRRRLGALITWTPGGYRLDVEPEQVDVHRFERLVHEKAYGAALLLWRGTPLADIGSDELRDREGARLEALHVSAVERHAEARIESGRPEEVIDELGQIVRNHPLREPPRELLMRALDLSGRRAEAVELFWDLKRHLAEVLGVQPGREITASYQRLIREETADPDRQLLVALVADLSRAGLTRQCWQLMSRLATVHLQRGRLRVAEDVLLDCLAYFRDGGDRQEMAITLATLGALYERAGRIEDAAARLGEALSLLPSDGEAVAWVMHELTIVRLAQDRPGDARALAGRELDMGRRQGDRVCESYGLSGFAWVCSAAGAHAETRRWAEAALRAHRQLEDRYGEAYDLLVLGHAQACLGLRRVARETMDLGLRLLGELGDPYGQTLGLIMREEAGLSDGAGYRRAVELAASCGFDGLHSRALNAT